MRFLALLSALACAGCIPDFDRFNLKPPPADVAGEVIAAPDVIAPVDIPGEIATDASVDVPSESIDAAVTCTPGRASEARFRFANMGTGMGPVELCMRRRATATAFSRVTSTLWPTGGVSYAQVSTSVPFNAEVTRPNEAWDIAVVRSGTPCGAAAMSAITLRSVQLDPGVLRLFVFTTERSEDGTSVGVLNVLADGECTDCGAFQVDVRGVHAALGASQHRLSFSLDPLIDPRLIPPGISTMRTFSSGAAYGGDLGYACNAMWGAIAAASLPGALVSVQLSAATVAGVALARSEATRLKVTLLQRTRTVTVFFEGDFDAVAGTGSGPGFLVCYDGVSEGAFTSCDRVAATLASASDAGADAATPDAATDAHADVEVGVDAGDAEVTRDADDDAVQSDGHDVADAVDEVSPVADADAEISPDATEG